MVIVSQDKKAIVNFANISRIYVDSADNSIMCTLIGVGRDGVLAIYKTEEKAKEVLQDLISTYSNNELSKQMNDPHWIVRTLKYRAFIYEMPKD